MEYYLHSGSGTLSHPFRISVYATTKTEKDFKELIGNLESSLQRRMCELGCVACKHTAPESIRTVVLETYSNDTVIDVGVNYVCGNCDMHHRTVALKLRPLNSCAEDIDRLEYPVRCRFGANEDTFMIIIAKPGIRFNMNCPSCHPDVHHLNIDTRTMKGKPCHLIPEIDVVFYDPETSAIVNEG